MPQDKPLPTPPHRGAKVLTKLHLNTKPTPSMPGLSPTSSEYSSPDSPTPPSKSHRKASRVKYHLPKKDKVEKSAESDTGSANLAPTKSSRPSLKGLTFQKSPREMLLERRLASLEQENAELRRELRLGAINENKEKDELIALLHNQNRRYKAQIQQQADVVAQIANKIGTAFQEYQEMMEKADLSESRESESEVSESDSSKSDNFESDHHKNAPTKLSSRISSYLRYNLDSD
ncbi:hypothetical protein F5Y08DRAFT_345272 [Xylaria arbuscula]|nr:hypothetical protein F5Y08DRAFT_345272 [Xylaria arbuscula]